VIGRYLPERLRHAPPPGAHGFAFLACFEASVRAILVSVWPLVLYDSLGTAAAVSRVYFVVGILSLSTGLMVPWINRHIPRRWMYTIGGGLYLAGGSLGIAGGPVFTPAAMLSAYAGTVTIFICFNAYVMDYIARTDLGRSETLRLTYSAVPWAIGPFTGVWLWKLWHPAPFLVAMAAACLMLALFWAMRLGNGKLITRARGPAPNPLAYLGRFAAQPRLIAGWLFAVLRSVGWWVYVVYLPIFCIQSGLGDRIGSFAFSASNALLFLAPAMLRWMQVRSLRHGVRTAFACASLCYLVAAFAGFWPPLAVIAMFAGSAFLVMLDTFGGLPFLMAVRPAERTEMSAVYSSFRDVSGILTPGVSWVVLLVAPVTGVFAACAGGLAVGWLIAGRLHPRLAARRGVPAETRVKVS
jgi:MFS transporter, ACDE family, multidrug resistance protein